MGRAQRSRVSSGAVDVIENVSGSVSVEGASAEGQHSTFDGRFPSRLGDRFGVRQLVREFDVEGDCRRFLAAMLDAEADRGRHAGFDSGGVGIDVGRRNTGPDDEDRRTVAANDRADDTAEDLGHRCS